MPGGQSSSGGLPYAGGTRPITPPYDAQSGGHNDRSEPRRPHGDGRKQRSAYAIRRTPGAPVESLRSKHARVAALARHRGENSLAVTYAREELNRACEETRARVALGRLTPAARAAFLASFDEAAA